MQPSTHMRIRRRLYRKRTRGVFGNMNILNIEHVSKLYVDKWIFDDISCGIH